MRRRNFVGNLLGAGALGALAPDRAPAAPAPEPIVPDTAVKRVPTAGTRPHRTGEPVETKHFGISPFEVVTGGNRAMHAVLGGLRYQGPEGGLRIETLDAPVVAPGEKLPVHFSRNQPDLAKGFHFSLFNNGWGTNYVQWFGEDARFRFRISA